MVAMQLPAEAVCRCCFMEMPAAPVCMSATTRLFSARWLHPALTVCMLEMVRPKLHCRVRNIAMNV